MILRPTVSKKSTWLIRFYAIAIYRLSHELYNRPFTLSRLMSEYAHRITGTDIHAGAQIASPFFVIMQPVLRNSY
jgi:serine acetyltransferase